MKRGFSRRGFLAFLGLGAVAPRLLGNGLKVYVDPAPIGESVLLGYKGSVEIETGFFYCPYIPLQINKCTDPVETLVESFAQNYIDEYRGKVSFHTRYGLVEGYSDVPHRSSQSIHARGKLLGEAARNESFGLSPGELPVGDRLSVGRG